MPDLILHGEDIMLIAAIEESKFRLTLEDSFTDKWGNEASDKVVALFDKEEAVQLRDKLNEFINQEYYGIIRTSVLPAGC